ncbi:uncharacterized protein LOC128736056 [Sabethes cyaneus]|uniref:uncharacterized protein LOC128736056 n=1 Tax=Sabethes cyaneus TaxID=53552 RepID=UPI00237EC118|nr:uncharacterized protein LOC128736056 [Sabethes cyaneus]
MSNNNSRLQQYPNGAFDDQKPEPDPNNQQFKNYVSVLTRFDDWVTGHSHVRSPQEVLPDDEFNDLKPQVDPNNQQFNEYVKVLTRFDPWVTGQKVPIPADPTTDALHQDFDISNVQELPNIVNNEQNQNKYSENNVLISDSKVHNQETIPFNDGKPNIPPNAAFNEYVKVLTRFDPWVTGEKVPIPPNPETDVLHQVFKRSLISPEEHFADQFSDPNPYNPTANDDYNSFVKELKRFDPWITGQKVPIPRDPVTDALHQIRRRANNGIESEQLISSRSRRAIIFRPIFVYRLQQLKKADTTSGNRALNDA